MIYVRKGVVNLMFSHFVYSCACAYAYELLSVFSVSPHLTRTRPCQYNSIFLVTYHMVSDGANFDADANLDVGVEF